MTSQQFKEWRTRLGLSQAQAAERLGISAGSVFNYEAGRRREDNRPVEIPKSIELACAALSHGLSGYLPSPGALQRTGFVDLTYFDGDETSTLLCPRCRSGHMHHMGVTTYERGEDAAKLVKVSVFGPKAVLSVEDNNTAGNPSSRRDGLAVAFRCEGCNTAVADDVLELTIAQHKGETEVAWRFSPMVKE